MSDRLPKHLHDALTAARQALAFMSGSTLAQYQANAMLRSAVERQLEIVGVACRRAIDESPTLREQLPEASLAIAMRNRIAHGYDSVDDAIVHNTVMTALAPLAVRLERLLAAPNGP